ncbi:ABC transporter ATP-binding protein [Chitinasiproducens palmae]|uniref:Putative spermidine/putrescine transport system ATP-binding protein n=1 Tax=Chitinasiproducens palmae TaxID=1770053 RepID=A0A1H2PRA1_9BURK|nr:ABC transporter ATP-binding protein [Chitinasiproducens palmae]SDV49407.1 putative spermidine/putrescine transport system ATP-binding protein [Chitinasiproducens palmae]
MKPVESLNGSNRDASDSSGGGSRATAGAPVAVSMEGVVAKYRDLTILHDLSLKIAQGEFLTLLGPSGCGKTTLLNLIAGFTQADTGEIFIDGKLVTDLPAHQREIGIVFQSYALFPHMDVARNIGYGLRMRGVGAREIAQRVDAAMALVKLGGLGHRKPRELSGGQQQRVALARALVIRPKVLLLDEPFSALDKGLRGAMQVEIREIQRELGVTTVFVTHDQGEALSMSDRIAVMSQGRICQIATPDEIYRRPTDPFVASFLGDVNILPSHFHGEDATHYQLRLGGGLVSVERERLVGGEHGGGRMDIYVRPEHIGFEPLGADSVLTGTVVNHVFQGDHVDSYVDVNVATHGSQRVMVRTAGLDAIERFPIGTVTALALPPRYLTVFPEAVA